MHLKTITMTVLAGSLLASPGWSQDDTEFTIPEDQAATARQLAEAGLESDLAWDIVESLTTEIGPRLGGSEAEARARDWGVRTLTELGFENVRIEEFEMPYWERGELDVAIVSPFPQAMAATELGGSATTPEGGVTAEIVFFESFDDLQDAPAGVLDGRIAYINDRMVRAHDGAGYGPANRKRSLGWIEAQSRGAVGLLIRSVGTDSHRMPHTGNMSRVTENTLAQGSLSDVAADYVRATYPDLSEAPARSQIPAIALSAPDADQVERIHRMGEAIEVSLHASGGWQSTTTSGNVIGEIVGRELPEEIIVIGGHLDSWDEGTGAVDDGAGIAITVAAARLIAELPENPRRTIRVIMFGAEEVGLLGGFDYAQRYADSLGDHVVASESDFGAGPVWRLSSNVSEEGTAAMDEILRIIAPYGVIRGERAGGGGGPDIIPMAMRGVPTFRLEQEGSDYFDLHHTPDDTLDKIDPDELAQNVAVWAATVYLAAELDVEFRTADEQDGRE